MVAKAPEELEALARRYVADHFPALKDGPSSRTLRQAKTPGAPKQYVFDFRGTGANSTQRLRLVLDGEGKVVKVTASR